MSEVPDGLREIDGVESLITWFGYWPAFHDAEVLTIELARSGTSTILVHAFEMTHAVNQQGFFVSTKHVVVKFLLEKVDNVHLDGFNSQNVISGLSLSPSEGGYRLSFGSCYGVEGSLTATSIRIQVDPGIPDDSIYRSERSGI